MTHNSEAATVATEAGSTVPGGGTAAATSVCANCGAGILPDQSFCEACGFELVPTAPPAPATVEELASPITLSRSIQADLPDDVEDTLEMRRPCQSCGGTVGADGYCETCGTKATSERDHYTEHPASWAAACCDRGIRHHRNEDATAIAAEPTPGSRAVLVVCDGVSTSQDSDVAALAGARAARDVLVAQKPAGLGLPASRAAALAGALESATARANAAVIENTAADSDNAASCTFAAAVIEGDLVVFGNVGDSRVYWIPDAGQAEAPQELSRDDSVAQFRIAAGVSREQAENGPQAHAITKWLGRDSPDFKPRTGSITVTSGGWLMVCSDGLWNYVSAAEDMQTLVSDLSRAASEPLALAESLVRWANEQGGKDNISVALARH
ncbi:MAG: protein phosphatase 2C domain-containing protein [Propionibacteriaceae bacterium]|nr:protein phosphatase 2C domain-containing protein [Propionibacteriaceae bacterium]